MDIFSSFHEKPKKYRKKMAYAATGFLGVLILGAWLIIAGNSVRQAANPIRDIQATDSLHNNPLTKKESLKTNVVENQEENIAPNDTNVSNENFETLLKKQPEGNVEKRIIER